MKSKFIHTRPSINVSNLTSAHGRNYTLKQGRGLFLRPNWAYSQYIMKFKYINILESQEVKGTSIDLETS